MGEPNRQAWSLAYLIAMEKENRIVIRTKKVIGLWQRYIKEMIMGSDLRPTMTINKTVWTLMIMYSQTKANLIIIFVKLMILGKLKKG